MAIKPHDKISFYSKIVLKLGTIVEFLSVQQMKEELMSLLKHLERDWLLNWTIFLKLLNLDPQPGSVLSGIPWEVSSSGVLYPTSKILIIISIPICPLAALTLAISINHQP